MQQTPSERLTVPSRCAWPFYTKERDKDSAFEQQQQPKQQSQSDHLFWDQGKTTKKQRERPDYKYNKSLNK